MRPLPAGLFRKDTFYETTIPFERVLFSQKLRKRRRASLELSVSRRSTILTSTIIPAPAFSRPRLPRSPRTMHGARECVRLAARALSGAGGNVRRGQAGEVLGGRVKELVCQEALCHGAAGAG